MVDRLPGHYPVTDLPCANCGASISRHRCVHLIPCCPGKCPGSRVVEPIIMTDEQAERLLTRITGGGGEPDNGARNR